LSDIETKKPKPRWWKPYWIVLLLVTIALGFAYYLFLHVPLERAIGLLVFAVLCIGIAYYIRAKPSMKINRAIYILLGISPIGFGLSMAWAFTIGRYITNFLGRWGFFVGLIVPCIIGAVIGDWIGKKVNYRIPLFL
jgi:hypothetical protein